MLSILIPTYNHNITTLVSELHKQAMDTYVDFEIIVMEDGSTLFLNENKSVEVFENCIYIALEKNLGRSAIRNRLADQARYEHLLFLDCDAEICSTNFVSKFIVFCKDDNVVLGGRIYDQNDENPQYSLIRKYGMERERNDYHNQSERRKFPMFTTPNFLISKNIFNKIRFDESIKGYGHEDTVFGIMLHKLQIEFIFIDNPVKHIGLETNKLFIKKTENAIQNLLFLNNSGNYPLLSKESKLLTIYLRLKKTRLIPLFAFAFSISRNLLQKLLCSPRPSLLLFDLYKLLYLCKISLQK